MAPTDRSASMKHQPIMMVLVWTKMATPLDIGSLTQIRHTVMDAIPLKLEKPLERGTTLMVILFLVPGDMTIDLLKELGQLPLMNQILSSIQLHQI